jgi:hypothetical protein
VKHLGRDSVLILVGYISFIENNPTTHVTACRSIHDLLSGSEC